MGLRPQTPFPGRSPWTLLGFTSSIPQEPPTHQSWQPVVEILNTPYYSNRPKHSRNVDVAVDFSWNKNYSWKLPEQSANSSLSRLRVVKQILPIATPLASNSPTFTYARNASVFYRTHYVNRIAAASCDVRGCSGRRWVARRRRKVVTAVESGRRHLWSPLAMRAAENSSFFEWQHHFVPMTLA